VIDRRVEVKSDAASDACHRPTRSIPNRNLLGARVMTSILQILLLILDVVWFIMIAHIIMSWLINFQVLNLRQPLVAQIWHGLNRLLEPLYQPIRRLLPDLVGIDLAPLVALIGVYALRIVLINNAHAFV
jgi:YggT family protein